MKNNEVKITCCTANKAQVIQSYLTYRKQTRKINNCFSEFIDFFIGDQQGSISLFFNIYICDLFFFTEDEIATSYADDTTPSSNGNNVVTASEDREAPCPQ